jgi:general secretion pathway protein K
MAGLVALVAALAVGSRETIHAEWNRVDERRADLMVEAGVQRAIAEIQQADTTHITQADTWASLGKSGSVQYTVGYDSFRIEIIDAGSLINLNSADSDQLQQLPLSQQQIDSLMDWREPGTTSRGQGAKDDFYNALPTAYNAKLKPFDSVDELLQVRGFTPESIYKPPSSLSPLQSASRVGSSTPLCQLLTTDSLSADPNLAGQPKVNGNSVTSYQLIAFGVQPSIAQNVVQAQQNQFKTLGDVLNVAGMTKDAARAILNNVTMGQDQHRVGLINLNTANETVLNSIPNLPSDAVSGILDHQSDGFQTLGELVDVPGMDMTTLIKTVDRFCVGSRTFIVRVIGQAGSYQSAAEVAVTVGDDYQVTMTRKQPLAVRDAISLWNWADSPDSKESIGVTP